MITFLKVLIENLPSWGPEMLWAAGETLQLTSISFLLAVFIGSFLAIIRTSRNVFFRSIALAFIEIGRGTPALVILFMIYFGLPAISRNLQFSSFVAAVIGLGLQGGAILAETFRAGIEAIDISQREASLSLGLMPFHAMVDVIAPQAFRIVLPPTGNYVIGLLKDTAIASIIAAPELMLRAKDLASSSFMPMHLYVLAGLIYFAMSYPLSLLVGRMEMALSKGRT